MAVTYPLFAFISSKRVWEAHCVNKCIKMTCHRLHESTNQYKKVVQKRTENNFSRYTTYIQNIHKCDDEVK